MALAGQLQSKNLVAMYMVKKSCRQTWRVFLIGHIYREVGGKRAKEYKINHASLIAILVRCLENVNSFADVHM